jgi:hypothetical protein
MSRARKAIIILGAPLTLATLLGGAAAFASQSGGGAPEPSAHGSGSGYHRITFADGMTPDGSDCPHDKGNSSSDAPVSPAVY